MSADLKKFRGKLCTRNGEMYTRALVICILVTNNILLTTGTVIDETDCPIPNYDSTKPGCICEKDNENCSSGPRHIGDSQFNCKLVKNFPGWSKGNVTDCTNKHCKPSLIVKINLRKDFKLMSNLPEKIPILNITFTVPQAYVSLPKDVGQGTGFYPGGILLNISTQNKDIFPISPRMFDFFGYSSTSTDNKQPRTITFPCIYGFKFVNNKSLHTVYVIELKTFSKPPERNRIVVPYTTLKYNITMYNYYAYHSSFWKTTMAVAQYPTPEDLYIVFDPAPEIFKAKVYDVILIDVISNTPSQEKQVIHGSQTYSTIFTNVADGFYKIKIVVKGDNCTGSCIEHLSHIIVMDNIDENTGVKELPLNNIIIWPILGGGIMCTLLITVFLYFWKQRYSQTKSVSLIHSLLLYSNSKKVNCKVATSFVIFLREKLKMSVTYDIDEQAEVVQDISNWYTRKLEMVDHVIVLWFPGANKPTSNSINTDSAIQDYFFSAVMKALCLKENRGTGFKLSCVFFDYTQYKTVSSSMKGSFKVFQLFKNFENFYEYVNQRSPPSSIRKFMTESEYKHSNLYSAVLEAIDFYKDRNQDVPMGEDDLPTQKCVLYKRKDSANDHLNNNESSGNIDNSTANEEHWSVHYCPVHGKRTKGHAIGSLTDDKVNEELHQEFMKFNFENRVPLKHLPSGSDRFYPSKRGDNSHIGQDEHRCEMDHHDHLCINSCFQFQEKTSDHDNYNDTVNCEFFLGVEPGNHKRKYQLKYGMEDGNNYRSESLPLLHPVSSINTEPLEEMSDEDNCRTDITDGNIFPEIHSDENHSAGERTVHESLLDLRDRHGRHRTISLNSHGSFYDGHYTDISEECNNNSFTMSDDSFQNLNTEEKFLYLNR